MNVFVAFVDDARDYSRTLVGAFESRGDAAAAIEATVGFPVTIDQWGTANDAGGDKVGDCIEVTVGVRFIGWPRPA